MKLDCPQSKPAVDAAVIFHAAAAHPPRHPCHASRRAAFVHAHFEHAHRQPASPPVSPASQPRALPSITDSLTDRQPCEIHDNSNRWYKLTHKTQG